MSVVTEVGAGALLVAGLLTPLACAAVISVMLVAGLLAHRPNGFFVFRDGYEYVLVLSVACLALAVLGPGRLSVDDAAGIDGDRLGRRRHRAGRGRGGHGGPARDVLAAVARAGRAVRGGSSPLVNALAVAVEDGYGASVFWS